MRAWTPEKQSDRQRPWAVKWREEGRQRSRWFSMKREAEAFREWLQPHLDRGLTLDEARAASSPNRTVTVGELASEWLDYRADLRLSPTTVARDRSYVTGHIIDSPIGPMLVQDLDGQQVDLWLASEFKDHAGGTAAKGRQLLSQILDHHLRSKDAVIRMNPVSVTKSPKTARRREPRIVTPSEVWEFADAFDPNYYALPITIFGCGLRIQEALGLRRDRVDLNAGNITIDSQLDRKGLLVPYTKTDASRATLPLAPEVSEALKDHMDRFTDELVFTTPSSTPILYRNLMRGPWSRAVTESGIEVTPHDLRHSYSQYIYNSGIPMLDHQRLMRHSSPVTTLKVYTNADASGPLVAPPLPHG